MLINKLFSAVCKVESEFWNDLKEVDIKEQGNLTHTERLFCEVKVFTQFSFFKSLHTSLKTTGHDINLQNSTDEYYCY